MTVFRGRPLAGAIGVWLILALVLMDLGAASAATGAALLLPVVFGTLSLHLHKTARRASLTLALLFCFSLAAILRVELFFSREVLPAVSLTHVQIENGVVESAPYPVTVSSPDGLKVCVPPDAFDRVPAVGDRVSLRGTAGEPEGGGWYSVDQRALLRSRGVFVFLSDAKAVILSDPPAFTVRVRRAIRDALSSLRRADVASAALLGDKSALGGELRDSLASAGASHLAAVSGLHLSVILFAFAALADKLTLPPAARLAITLVPALFYAALLDFSPSVTRAAIMAILLRLASLLRRESDPVTSLFVAAFIITAADPCSLWDPGFRMSFLATLGILRVAVPVSAAVRRRFERIKCGNPFALAGLAALQTACGAFAVCAGAVLFSLPVSASLSPALNPLILVFNVILAALFSPALILCALYVPFALLSGAVPFFSIISSALGAVCDRLLLIFITALDAAPDPVRIWTPATREAVILLLAAAVIILLVIRPKPLKILAVTLSLTVLCCGANLAAASLTRLELSWIPAGNGGFLILRSRDSVDLVADADRPTAAFRNACELLGIRAFHRVILLNGDPEDLLDTLRDSFGADTALIPFDPDGDPPSLPGVIPVREGSRYTDGDFSAVITKDGSASADLSVGGIRICLRSDFDPETYPVPIYGDPDCVIRPGLSRIAALPGDRIDPSRSFCVLFTDLGIRLLQG